MKDANVYALFFSLFVISTSVTGIRIAVRLRWGLRKLFPEDVLIIIAWCAYLALIVDLSLAVDAGLAASTRDEFSPEDPEKILEYFFLHGYAMFTCLWLIKFSIIAFYARLVWTTARMYRIVTYCTYTILGCTFIVAIFYKTFNCYPLPRVWDPRDQCTGGPTTQYTRIYYLLTTQLLDIVTDLICLILPFAILRNLHIDLRKKIALGCIFAVALMSMVCACIRLSAGLKQGSKLSVAVWAAVEASTALCVASAPALRPLIFRTSYFSRGSSRSRSQQLPPATSSHRGFTSKSRNGGGTNVSQNPLRDSLELNNNGVKVTKIVQVTTVDVERGTSSQSSSDSFLDPGSKNSRGIEGIDGGIDPRVMGYQAEVVGGRLNRSASIKTVSDVGMWGGSEVGGKRSGGSDVGKRPAS